MDKLQKLERYYTEDHHYKEAINLLRKIVLKTELKEDYKWNFPTYTLVSKNVLAICKFKSHFGIWFFNGVFLKDVHQLLTNAQEGKTKAMRHWKFTTMAAIDMSNVSEYLHEAIENEKKGLRVTSTSKTTKKKILIPVRLQEAFKTNKTLEISFKELTASKQREYADYIASAKQEKTKESRLHKITPIIIAKKGLNDMYR